MAIRANQSASRKIGWSVLLLLIIVGVRFYRDYQHDATPPARSRPLEEVESSTIRQNGWTIHRQCSLVAHQHNDGDSFHVKLPDGSEREFRLYFVDTPESQFKRYRDGNTNAHRIAEQARYFNNISSDKAVAVGKRAKEFTLNLLGGTYFDVITKKEAVFDSERYYAHIELNYQAQRQRLDEILVRQGFARIYTKGEDLADGTKIQQHLAHLRSLESQAKHLQLGAWK